MRPPQARVNFALGDCTPHLSQRDGRLHLHLIATTKGLTTRSLFTLVAVGYFLGTLVFFLPLLAFVMLMAPFLVG